MQVCSRGYKRKGSSCRVCGKGFYKPDLGACIRCPDGTTTTGRTAADHDERRDCVPGGLIPSTQKTGATLEKLQEFEGEWIRALDNSGGRNKPKTPGGGRGRTKACLYDCDASEWNDEVERASIHVMHLAGSPLTYSSNNPADVFAGVNLVGTVRDQGQCATCVSHAVVSAAISAVAAAVGVDARQINLSFVFPYFCGHVFKLGSLGRSCNSGWSFNEALQLAGEKPEVFFVNDTCTDDVIIQRTALSNGALLRPQCQLAASQCPTAAFTCAPNLLSDGIVRIQQEIRTRGAVMTRILVDSAFRRFFQSNPTGVFNGSADGSIDWTDAIYHAVLLVGYDNLEFHWLVLNSWGESWGDKGLFRIAYGVADVGHPEDTYSLSDCFTTSTDPATVAAWSRPRPVWPDPEAGGCYLYKAVAKDSISGIADHFYLLDILQLVMDNVDRGVIPLLTSPDTGSQEPQLQPPSGSWAGTTFRVCDIPEYIFSRVATVTAPPSPQARQLNALLSIKAELLSPTSTALQDWSSASGADGGYCDWPEVTCDEFRSVTNIKIQEDLGGIMPKSGSWLELSGLRQIQMPKCKLKQSALPAVWARLPLEFITFGNALLSATLPPEWSEMPALTSLDLTGTGLIGSIPGIWARMFGLQQLFLGGNQLTGFLPNKLPSGLEELDVCSNKLIGALPASLATLGSLQFFNASSNNLSGTIPAAWGLGLVSLSTFDVSSNPNLQGCVPAEFSARGVEVVSHGTRISGFCGN